MLVAPDEGQIDHEKLREIAERVRDGGEDIGITVRQLLLLFGFKRRGHLVEWFIDGELLKLGLATRPSFKLPTKYESVVRFVCRLTDEEIEALLDEFNRGKL